MILTQAFPLNIEFQWYSPANIIINDAKLKNWLLATGSLTERLQSHCRQFSVSVIGQGVAELLDNEKQALGIEGESWIVREVILCGDGVPWVFARSVMPKAELDGDLCMLSNLGNKPLGKVIFNDTQFKRLPIQVTQLEPTNSLLNKLSLDTQNPLFGRRSIFRYQESRLLVAEIFLPLSPAYSQPL